MKSGGWRTSACVLAVAMVLAASSALAGEKLETTTDKITIPNSVVQFTLVKLPAGKVTLKDKDGKDKEVEIKPIWIGQTEVTWDEYDIYWQVLDMPADPRKGLQSGKEVNRTRPSAPYKPAERERGHDGTRA